MGEREKIVITQREQSKHICPTAPLSPRLRLPACQTHRRTPTVKINTNNQLPRARAEATRTVTHHDENVGVGHRYFKHVGFLTQKSCHITTQPRSQSTTPRKKSQVLPIAQPACETQRGANTTCEQRSIPHTYINHAHSPRNIRPPRALTAAAYNHHKRESTVEHTPVIVSLTSSGTSGR